MVLIVGSGERRRVLQHSFPLVEAVLESEFGLDAIDPTEQGAADAGESVVVGHSYGALTALLLAVKHPELVRTLVLAEAPAVSLLLYLLGVQSAAGKETYLDIQQWMVKPMKAAFANGDQSAGLSAFINFVLDDPQAWSKMPEAARQDLLNHAHEWDVMLNTGELFPALEPEAVRRIAAPALLLSGEKSYRFSDCLTKNSRVCYRTINTSFWLGRVTACGTSNPRLAERRCSISGANKKVVLNPGSQDV